MLEVLDNYDATAPDRKRVLEAFSAPAPEGVTNRRQLLAEWEERIADQPQQFFKFDEAGYACLGSTYAAGRFQTLSLAQLRCLSQTEYESRGQIRLWILKGTHPLTDIGALQAFAPAGSLFQVASQFNCLEAPGPRLVPVANYLSDPTQGPRASVSAFPGTLLRHYQAPDNQGGRFRQSAEQQLNLLHAVGAPVKNGYLLSSDVAEPAQWLHRLESDFELLEVGVHDGVEVVLGANWGGAVRPGTRIAQVFTSTLAAGAYSRLDNRFLPICSQLLRAAYLGTLLAAASLRQRRVVLTMIGGGVFANPLPLIWEAVLWACSEVSYYLPQDLTVILNGRDLHSLDSAELRRQAQVRGGDLLHCTSQGVYF